MPTEFSRFRRSRKYRDPSSFEMQPSRGHVMATRDLRANPGEHALGHLLFGMRMPMRATRASTST